jgi:hypothetical protein
MMLSAGVCSLVARFEPWQSTRHEAGQCLLNVAMIYEKMGVRGTDRDGHIARRRMACQMHRIIRASFGGPRHWLPCEAHANASSKACIVSGVRNSSPSSSAAFAPARPGHIQYSSFSQQPLYTTRLAAGQKLHKPPQESTPPPYRTQSRFPRSNCCRHSYTTASRFTPLDPRSCILDHSARLSFRSDFHENFRSLKLHLSPRLHIE